MEEPKPETTDAAKRMERRAAQAMVAAYVQVARSTHMAHFLQQSRERSLERRAERAKDMQEILALQHQIDAQQPQAQVLSKAANHLRSQAANLARFAKAGLTLEDFERMGVGQVVDMEELKLALERETANPGAGAEATGVSAAAAGAGAETATPATVENAPPGEKTNAARPAKAASKRKARRKPSAGE
jgi:hypothetical protein